MECCTDLCFQRETFHLAVNYLDRFLAFGDTLPLKQAQLCSLAALRIAAKFMEVKTPSVGVYLEAAGNSFSHRQVI